jgi:hypothetical protein
MGGTYKALAQIGSGAITYILKFIKIGSDIEKLIEGMHRQTAR